MSVKNLLAQASLGIALGASLGSEREVQASPDTALPVIMGYYPSWRDTPIRYDHFTHIIQSFISADKDGKAVTSAAIPNLALISEAHSKDAKVILALGGGSNGKEFGEMVRDPVKNAQFIADVIKIMADSKADGLALDWEQPEASDKTATTDFVASLRAQMKAASPKSLLILVVNALPGNSQGYDGPNLRGNVDYLNVMTYDFHGPWNHAGHHTSLYGSKSDVEGNALSYPAALSYWRDVQGFRPAQIILGIAGYGRGFKVKAWGETPTAPSQYPDITFGEANALIGHGWTRQWDTEAHAPWLLSADKTDRISYDDEQSVADKARWMKKNGLPGFFIWELSQEYVGGDNVLTAAAQKAWNVAPG